jgi:hypothetical protein
MIDSIETEKKIQIERKIFLFSYLIISHVIFLVNEKQRDIRQNCLINKINEAIQMVVVVNLMTVEVVSNSHWMSDLENIHRVHMKTKLMKEVNGEISQMNNHLNIYFNHNICFHDQYSHLY